VRAASIKPHALLLAPLFLASCGYVGPVLPPSAQIPAAVKDLAAIERGGKIVISFRTPPRTADNIPIKQFSEIDLRIGPPTVPFLFDTWSDAAKAVPVNPPPPNDPCDPKPIPIEASFPIADLIGKKVVVAVRTAVKIGDHYSPWSNRVVLDVVQPVNTPTNVKVAASADGVVLDWTAVDAATGYRILRQSPGDKNLSEIGNTKTPNFVDTTSQFDVPYTYQVVAINADAESLPSELLSITPVDKFPPSVPGSVAALAGPESVEVSWQRSPEADTAGYFVYRSVDGAAFERQGDMVKLPAFSDRKVEHGKSYRYQITSVDQKNNESERSPLVEVAF
jgi:hypothetical protein